MKPQTKKALWITALAIVTTGVALAVRQYQKLMNYVIGKPRILAKTVSIQKLVFGVVIPFKNTSDVTFTLKSYLGKAYVNGKFITSVESSKVKLVPANSTTDLSFMVEINPNDVGKALGQNWAVLLTDPKSVKIALQYSIRVSLWGIGIPISGAYFTDLAEITKAKKT